MIPVGRTPGQTVVYHVSTLDSDMDQVLLVELGIVQELIIYLLLLQQLSKIPIPFPPQELII